MPRLMSVAMTEEAVIERRKNVTRRSGWWLDKNGKPLVVVGDHLVLVRKAMGRKPGEPLVRLAEVEVVSVSREPLTRLWDWGVSPEAAMYAMEEVRAEGFPGMTPDRFVQTCFVDAQGMNIDDEVTRILWRYLDTYTRPSTDTVRLPTGGSRIKVKRCCNGCGRELGDANDTELEAAVNGRPLPDVRDECGRHIEEKAE